MSEKEKPEMDEAAAEAGEVEIEYLTHRKPTSKKKSTGAKVGSAPIKALQAQIEKKNVEIENLQQEAERMREEFLRNAADKENLRKRLEREKNDYFQYALADLLRELLTVLDNFERALDSGTEQDGPAFREGIDLIYRHYLDALRKRGVTPMDTELARFDPTLQQAFITEESEEVEEPTVSEVLQKGYMLHGRLLRPAMVKVAVPKKKED